MSFVMQRTQVFCCDSDGLTAPGEMIRPRRGRRPRYVAPPQSVPFHLGVGPAALDEEWGESVRSIGGGGGR
jgi:hypothetical protein